MNRFYLFLFLTVLLNKWSQAQDSTIQYRSPHVILKVAPLALLLDTDATLEGGLEVRTGRRSSVQAQVGFGHKGLSVVKDEKKNFADWSIWRIRSEWRHYTNRYRTSTKKNIHIRSNFPLGNYLAVEGFAKQITGTKNISFYNGIGSVPPVTLQSIDRFVWGSRVKWGRQIAIPGESLTSLSRALLDFYVGVGALYGNTQLDPTTEYCGCGIFRSRFEQGHAIRASVTAGLNIGFGF